MASRPAADTQSDGPGTAGEAVAAPSADGAVTRAGPSARLQAVSPEDEAPITAREVATAMLTEWFFVAWPFWLLGFAGGLALLAPRSVILWTVLALAFSTALWPAHTKWDTFLHSYILSAWRKYHSFRYVVPENLRRHRSLVLAMFPHGISPVGQIILASLSDRLFPGTFVRGFVPRGHASRRRDVIDASPCVAPPPPPPPPAPSAVSAPPSCFASPSTATSCPGSALCLRRRGTFGVSSSGAAPAAAATPPLAPSRPAATPSPPPCLAPSVVPATTRCPSTRASALTLPTS